VINKKTTNSFINHSIVNVVGGWRGVVVVAVKGNKLSDVCKWILNA
jgi:hypothetical protein